MAAGLAPKRAAVTRALGRALEPVAELCLELGFTSAELESLVRSVFVHQAIALLARKAKRKQDRRAVSDVRVGLATGLHRNEVRKIRGAKPRVEPKKLGRRHRALRILRGWTEDWRFLNDSGQPRELPLHPLEDEPSFEELVRKYMPGAAVGSALSELRRSGTIQLLPDEMVRVLSRTPRPIGLNATSLADATDKVAALAHTVFRNLLERDGQLVCGESEVVEVARARLPLVRKVLERRVRTFLDTLAKELSVEEKDTSEAVKMRIVVFAPEG